MDASPLWPNQSSREPLQQNPEKDHVPNGEPFANGNHWRPLILFAEHAKDSRTNSNPQPQSYFPIYQTLGWLSHLEPVIKQWLWITLVERSFTIVIHTNANERIFRVWSCYLKWVWGKGIDWFLIGSNCRSRHGQSQGNENNFGKFQ